MKTVFRTAFATCCALALGITLAGCRTPTPGGRTEACPDEWAEPLELEGVPNFYKVSDDLYRSAQPTTEGMSNLRDLGIETIVNLRSFHSDRDRIGKTGMAYEHIYMKPWHPETEDVVRFIRIAVNPRRTPVLVHCKRGADRTGTMCAAYRIIVQQWSTEDAIEEMLDGGYDFDKVLWPNLVTFVKELDVDGIRDQAGLPDDPETGGSN
jgi:tyrosine-protein phosphatase SIW14